MGAIKPPTALSSVDLPHPEGPKDDEAIASVDLKVSPIGRGYEMLRRFVLQRHAANI